MRKSHLLLVSGLLALGCRPEEDTGKNGGGGGSGDGAVDEDGDGFSADEDCDDSDAAINPDADEVCDGVDNDCDDEIDNEAVDASVWFTDSDGDGFGDPDAAVEACEQPSDAVDNDEDCDDADAEVNPETVWAVDADMDGFGDSESVLTQCEQPDGYVLDGTDCDDGAADVFPGAEEYCDGVDRDCDGDGLDPDSVDASDWFPDVDGDGFGDAESAASSACEQPSGFVADNTDCLDSDELVYPDSHEIETPNDGVDQDCDGVDVCTDLTCDGYADIVFANWRENGSTYTADSYIYHGTAGGFSWLDRTGLSSVAAFASDVADYNQDGYLDVVLASFLPSDYTTSSTVFWGSASGHSASDTDAIATIGARSVCSGDFDADGFPDTFFPAFANNGPVFATNSSVHYGSAAGFTDAATFATVGAFDCVVDDLNADGFDDVVVISNTEDDTDPATRYSTTSTIFWGASAGLASTNVTELSTYGARRVAVEDVDGDGWSDLVIANHKVNTGVTSDDDEAYTIVFWSDAGTFDDADATELLTWGGYDSAVGDFDGDGFNDIAVAGWTGPSGGSSGSTVFWGSSSGWSVADSTTVASNSSVWASAADLNQDGIDDLVLSNYRDTSPATDSYVYYGSATGLSASDRVELPTLGSRRHTVADVNGDGWSDIVFANFFDPATANRADSMIYYNSASGFDPASVDAVATFGTRWTPIVAGD